MATEAVLQLDSSTIAAADYSNTASLYGMMNSGLTGQGSLGGSGQFLFVAISTAADRTSVVASAAGQQVFGILQNKPKLGGACNVAISGISKVVTGSGGVTRGAAIMTDANGCAVVWTTGSGKVQVGIALETVAANSVATVHIFGGQQKLLT